MKCIICPKGCEIEISGVTDRNLNISGYLCPKGRDYAESEIINPSRILTSTIKVKNGSTRRLPVRSEVPVPKEMIFELMKKIKEIEIEAPVRAGDIIIENILNKGINIISSKSME